MLLKCFHIQTGQDFHDLFVALEPDIVLFEAGQGGDSYEFLRAIINYELRKSDLPRR